MTVSRLVALFAAFCIIVLGVSVSAQAQIPLKPDEDWTDRSTPDGPLVFMSPADNDGNHVLLMIGTADPKSGSFDAWMEIQVNSIATALGTLRSHRGRQTVENRPLLFGPLVQDAVEIDADDGTQISALLYGYAGPRNWQPIAIVMPAGYPTDAPLVTMALERVNDLRRFAYERVLTQPPNQPPPAPAPAPSQSADVGDIRSWGTWQTERAITRIAPCTADGAHVAATLMPAWNIDGEPLGQWFNHRIGGIVAGWSGSGISVGPLPQTVDVDSLTATHEFRDQQGNFWAVWFRAVQRGNRAQMAAVIAPTGIGNADPRVNAAYNYVRDLYAGGYTLLPEQAKVTLGNALDYNIAGTSVVGALRASGLQTVGNGSIGTPEDYVLLDNGRAFRTTGGEFSASSSQATWRRTATGYELDWPGLQIHETVPASCFSTAKPATATLHPDAPLPAAKKVCSKVPMTTTYLNGGTATFWVDMNCN